MTKESANEVQKRAETEYDTKCVMIRFGEDDYKVVTELINKDRIMNNNFNTNLTRCKRCKRLTNKRCLFHGECSSCLKLNDEDTKISWKKEEVEEEVEG